MKGVNTKEVFQALQDQVLQAKALHDFDILEKKSQLLFCLSSTCAAPSRCLCCAQTLVADLILCKTLECYT